VKAVIKPQIDQFASTPAPTTLGKLIEICDSVSRESQCYKELHVNVQSKLKTKFTNKIWVSDGIHVLEKAANVQCESVAMTTIM